MEKEIMDNKNQVFKDIDANISNREVSKLILEIKIREIDVYMIVKYYVCTLMSDKKTPPEIMDLLANLKLDMIRNAMSKLVKDYGINFKMPETINSIPSYFNMFISDTTSRLVGDFIKEGFMEANSETNEGMSSRIDQNDSETK